MTQNPTVKLPVERLDQLKAIGDVLKLSIADVIGYMIRKEIAAGTIPDTIPGITVTRAGYHTIVAFVGDRGLTLSEPDALGFAKAIRQAADGERSLLDMDADFGAVRIGNGVKVIMLMRNDAIEKILSRDVARDLSLLIERIASAPAL